MLKARFPILNLMPNFKQSRLCYMSIVCYTLHNFIHINNRGDELFNTWEKVQVQGSSVESQVNGDTKAFSSNATQRHVLEVLDEAKRLMNQFRDDITDLIWADCVTRGH